MKFFKENRLNERYCRIWVQVNGIYKRFYKNEPGRWPEIPQGEIVEISKEEAEKYMKIEKMKVKREIRSKQIKETISIPDAQPELALVSLKRIVSLLNEKYFMSYEPCSKRKGSIEDEKNIKRFIKNNLSHLKIEKDQCWFPADVEESDDHCPFDMILYGVPINIKSTILSSAADNASSTPSVIYARYGVPLNLFLKGQVRIGELLELKRLYCVENKRNVYYLVMDKTSRVFKAIDIWDLKEEEIQINGNNLPYQIRWKKVFERLSKEEIGVSSNNKPVFYEKFVMSLKREKEKSAFLYEGFKG